MKKIFSYPSPSAHYKNQQGILRCSDQRFEPAALAFLSANGFQMADPIVRPGAAKILARPKQPRDCDCLVEEIALLKTHGFSEFYPTAHMECAACDGNTEVAFYESMLKSAADILRNRIPDLIVKPLFFDFDGFYEV